MGEESERFGAFIDGGGNQVNGGTALARTNVGLDVLQDDRSWSGKGIWQACGDERSHHSDYYDDDGDDDVVVDGDREHDPPTTTTTTTANKNTHSERHQRRDPPESNTGQRHVRAHS